MSLPLSIASSRPSQAPAALPVPAWRLEPYRLFFPLGAVAAASGVVPWLLFALGLTHGWPRGMHALIEIEGFLTFFAAGFLFTFVPRRSKTAHPAAWEAGSVLAGTVAVCVLAWAGLERWAHGSWAAVILVLGLFAARRMLPAISRTRMPAAFLWVPTSLVLAGMGALAAAALSSTTPWIAALGTNVVWNGLFGGLILGIGALLLPVMTRNQTWPDRPSAGAEWLTHAALALAFFGSFALELRAPSVALWVRAAVALGVLLRVGELWRRPTVPGLHRRIAWTSTWLVPLGWVAAAVWPAQRLAMLHVTYIGGFALLTLAIGNHVLVAHTGNKALLTVSPRRLLLFALALGAAVAARLALAMDPAHLRGWMIAGASLFLIGVASWGAWITPRLRRAG